MTLLLAHGGGRLPADGESLPWTFPPLVTSQLILISAVYALAVGRLWRRAGVGRGGISFRRAGAFAGGVLVLFLALTSPIDYYSDLLSAVHMIQHMLLMGVAAPLLVLGAPGVAMPWALPLGLRRRIGRWTNAGRVGRGMAYLFWQPVTMCLLFAVVLWIWHLPVLYEATLHDDLFHDFQHFSFVVVACLFWRVLLDPVSRLRMSRMGAVFYLFVTTLHATLLGVFMALAPTVWYPTYIGRTETFSLQAIEDQQLAGLIMWMPACMIYALVAALVLAHWLTSEASAEPSRV